MILKEDILRKIHSDFGENANNAINVLNKAVEEITYHETDRVLRCIIFLAKGSIDELHKHIEVAELDARDVMFQAEYEKIFGESDFKRLRDFNKTFEESTNDVRE